MGGLAAEYDSDVPAEAGVPMGRRAVDERDMGRTNEARRMGRTRRVVLITASAIQVGFGLLFGWGAFSTASSDMCDWAWKTPLNCGGWQTLVATGMLIGGIGGLLEWNRSRSFDP